MNHSIELMRHSAAHVMAAAVCRLFPNVQLDIGPATADGFIRLFEISGKGIKAREPQRVVAMEPPKQP